MKTYYYSNFWFLVDVWKEKKKKHPVTPNEEENITSAVNGKLWALTACGWGSESGRSGGGRV